MEDYETIKKYFTDKERENIQLKEELDNLRKTLTSYHEDKTGTSQDKNKSHIQDHNSSYIGMYFDHNTSRLVDDSSLKNELLTSRSLKRSKSNNTRLANDIQMNIAEDISKYETPAKEMGLQTAQHSQKSLQTLHDPNEEFIKILNSLDLGKLVDDNPITRRSNSTNIIFSNKNALKSIENSISALRSEINTYERNYENINNNLESNTNYADANQKKKTEYLIEELTSKIKLKEQEMCQVKELYENELRLKADIYNKNTTHLSKTHQEEIRKTRIDYENKMDELIKKSEEDNILLMKKISQLEKNSLISTSKQDVTEKNELIEFQKKYLNEMRDLQKNFENFKNKTYEEFKNLKKSKLEASEKANFYKDQIEKLKYQSDVNKENFIKMQKFYEESKKVIKTNQILANELEMSKAEVIFLKTKIAKLENIFSSRRANTNDADNNPNLKNLDMNLAYFSNGEKRNVMHSNKLNDYEANMHELNQSSYTNSAKNLKNLNLFSQPGSTRIISGVTLKNNNNAANIVNTNTSIYNTEEEMQSRAIDVHKAHQKMKEIEDCLYEMNNENEKKQARPKGGYHNEVNNNLNLDTQQSDYDFNTNFNYDINTNKSMRNTTNLALENSNSSRNLNNYIASKSVSNNFNNNKINTRDKYSTMSHNSKMNNSNLEGRLRQSNTYSAEIYDDFNYLGNNQDNNEHSHHSSYDTKKAPVDLLSHSAIIRDKSKGKVDAASPMVKSCIMSRGNPTTSDMKIINLKGNLSNANLNEQNRSSHYLKILDNDDVNYDNQDSNVYNEDPQDNCDDNIIEFPLQLRIKGKIKKISTLLEKRK